jgi:hypothetical protein
MGVDAKGNFMTIESNQINGRFERGLQVQEGRGFIVAGNTVVLPESLRGIAWYSAKGTGGGNVIQIAAGGIPWWKTPDSTVAEWPNYTALPV